MRNQTIFSMVSQVLADSREKLAAQESSAGTGGPSATPMDGTQPMTDNESSNLLVHAEKIAQACDYLASNIHNVVDQRSPQEKLAEYVAIQEWLAKTGGESDPPMDPPLDDGAGHGGPRSAMVAAPAMTPGGSILQGGDSGQASGKMQPPSSVNPNEKPNPTQAPNALETNLNDPPGGTKQAQARKLAHLVATGQIRKEAAAVLIKQGMSKKAGDEHTIDPGWSDAQQGMMAAQRAGNKGVEQFFNEPRLIGKSLMGLAGGGLLGAGAGALAGHALHVDPRAAAGVGGLLGGTAGQIYMHNQYLREKGIDPSFAGLGGARFTPEAAEKYLPAHYSKEAAEHAKLAQASGVPPKLARALLSKFAEDAINPAQISAGPMRIEAGTTPELQSIPGVPPSHMQGSEAGQQVPPTYGDTEGRNLIASNQAAIDATKRDARTSKTKSQMSGLLNEPAFSAAHDNVLGQSLENASSAGVKIAAARALLERWGNANPANKAKLAAAVKRANQEMAAAGAPAPDGAPPPPQAAAPAPGPGSAMPGGMSVPMPGGGKVAGAEGAPPVSDQALAMAAEGVTPEELAQAHMLLQQMGGGEATGAAPGGEMPGAAPGGAGAAGPAA